MAQRTRQRTRQRRRNQQLIGIIAVLAVVLTALIIIVAVLPQTSGGQPDSPSQVLTGWQESAAGRYYLNGDGSRATGWLELDGHRYYLNADGILQTGVVEADSKLWLLSSEGTLYTGGWIAQDNNRYYLNSDGSVYTGWLEAEGLRYYLDPAGPMHTGWLALEDGKYYLDADGVMQTGWIDADDQRYYLDANGHLYTGWLEQNGSKYYLKEDGSMARGKLAIDGVNWFFASNGTQLYMVNPWNSVPEGYKPDLVTLSSSIAYEGLQIDRSCYDALVQMVNECNAAMKAKYAGTGKTIPECFIISTYRSHSQQTANYQRMVQKYLDQGYGQAEAEKIAATIVAIPGTSEHQLGLAADIIDTQSWNLNSVQETLEAQQWLMANCWHYGFILRYPNGTTEVTGIIYEPWHYRYVGQELAKEITDSGLTLEQYLDALTK